MIRFVFILIISSLTLEAQVPQGIPYQAVARNGLGQPLANLPIKVRFSILDSTLIGPTVYSETHEPTTSAQGLFSVNVGMGNSNVGSFSSINWGVNAKFLKVELDTTASGNNYVDLGTQQMMSVPYALYAKNSGNRSVSKGVRIGYGQSGTWSCPSDVTEITVELWGGGGGGGSPANGYPGSNGGNGGYNRAVISVVPNQNYSVIIGSGGSGTNFINQYNYAVSNGGAGGVSTFTLNANNLITAEGGAGGIAGYMTTCNPNSWCQATSSQNGPIINWPYPNNIPNVPTAPYIPSSFVQNFPFGVAAGGQGGGYCTNGNSNSPCYSFLTSGGQPGQPGYCVISY